MDRVVDDDGRSSLIKLCLRVVFSLVAQIAVDGRWLPAMLNHTVQSVSTLIIYLLRKLGAVSMKSSLESPPLQHRSI